MNRPGNVCTATAAAGYVAVGLVSLARPERVPAVFGGTAPTPAARTEIRAVYGGLPLALAAAAVADPVAGGRTAAAVSLGMALGRLAGMAAEPRSATGAVRLFLGVELGLAALLAAGARAGR
ncbi:MAG TPA: DUF4345 family protein [Mycobacteriales bacterium]|nr:DUF4345 family protein [Mycobacteriales bacterium]